MGERILLSQAQVGDLEEEFVLDALRSGWVAPLGPHVDAFEREVAERVGVGHALALSSGTAALHLALLELGAGPGTVVVLPSMTFVATANAVVYTGATPVFVDSLADDGNVDPELLLEAVHGCRSRGKRVVAALTVDLFGRACDYDAIVPALDELGVPLLEDAAEALGATYRGRAAGAFGRAAVLSFNGNKVMTTSGGGMLLSDDAALVGHARTLSTQAREPVSWYEHTEIGYNYRLSNLLAALGRAQLRRLDEMIARRRDIRRRYQESLSDLPVRFLAPEDDAHVDNAWLTTLVVDDPDVSADDLVGRMNAEQIEVRHLWKPMHLQPVFASADSLLTGVSADLFSRGVTLPSGPALSDTQVDRVIDVLHQVLTRVPERAR